MAEQERPEEQRTVRLASIVAVDVVGFSSMSERDQRKAARHVENLRARIETVAAAHDGRLFNTAGDGFMLEFASAGSALGAIQDLLDKRSKGEPPIRVGAHVGDVIVTVTNDLLGHGVNVAARLQALAAPRSALVSAEFRSMARNSPSAAFQSRGRQPLDNIEQKVQTFEILSQRQRFTRFAKRVGVGAVTVAALAGVAFMSPYIFRTVQEQFNLRSQAEASAPAPEAPVDVAVQEVAALTPELSAAPVFQPGQVFRDCETCPELVVLSGGLFRMGSPASEVGRVANEGPQREVSLAPFAMATTEVTFAQWDACVAGGGCNAYAVPDRGWGRGDRPVIGVSWDDARAYVAWLNEQTTGPDYRLPTEAEWEFAARAGAGTRYAYGDAITARQAVFAVRRTAAVKAMPANALGLYGVHGNAAEWVQDCYSPSYDLAPIDGAAIEVEQCESRVVRGGSYSDNAAALRVAARSQAAADARAPGLGFRVARSLR